MGFETGLFLLFSFLLVLLLASMCVMCMCQLLGLCARYKDQACVADCQSVSSDHSCIEISDAQRKILVEFGSEDAESVSEPYDTTVTSSHCLPSPSDPSYDKSYVVPVKREEPQVFTAAHSVVHEEYNVSAQVHDVPRRPPVRRFNGHRNSRQLPQMSQISHEPQFAHAATQSPQPYVDPGTIYSGQEREFEWDTSSSEADGDPDALRPMPRRIRSSSRIVTTV